MDDGGMRYLGRRIDILPVPPDESATTWIRAGALMVGVEYRVLDDQAVLDNLARQSGPELDTIKADPGVPLDDHGISIHVSDAASGKEVLRFDCFEADPHYHYIYEHDGCNLLIGFDTAADGDPYEVTMRRLESRLSEMLTRAGRADLAEQMDVGLVEVALAQVRRIVAEGWPSSA